MTIETKRKCPLCNLTIKQCWSFGKTEEEEEKDNAKEEMQREREEVNAI